MEMNINWDVQQTSIFGWFKKGIGHLLVRARAGTGKTTTIIEAINYAPENKILLAAFNKEIATELTRRLKNPKAEAKTLHSAGFRELMGGWEGVKIDNERGEKLARKVAGVNAPDWAITVIKKLASLGKSICPINTSIKQLMDLADEYDLIQNENNVWNPKLLATHAQSAMQLARVKDGTCDFDDMIFVPLANEWVTPRYDMVVIDECQDMNYSQILLAQGLCKAGGRIVVVGDDRQAIYGFRGADSSSMDRLKEELKATELPLTVTYRCPKKVVAIAQALVPDYLAHPTAPEGRVEHFNPEQMYKGADLGDFVLSRKNAPLAEIALRFLRDGKRAIIKGRDIAKGLVKITKGIKANSVPDFLLRLNTWEEKQVTRLRNTNKNVDAKIELVRDQADTLRGLAMGLASVSEIQTRIESMFADLDPKDTKNVIMCSSVHRAKGLEAKNVWVLRDTLKTNKGGEESNITYVAYTRAKETLILVEGLGK
jgi:DNA helicase-2/ATP-dependent DNA helicase PcrA